MDQSTIDALSTAAGRTLTAQELDGIAARVDAAIHDLEAEDPAAWHALPNEERIARAGELAQMRYHAALLAQHRQEVTRMLSVLGTAPVRATSSAVLNGHCHRWHIETVINLPVSSTNPVP